MNRESFEFGTGSFVGTIMRDPSYFELPVHDRARIMGWVAGCPVVEELTDPANTEPGRGPDIMEPRYAQVNFWFGYINREIADLNPGLHEQFSKPVPRRRDEPVGKLERESIPDSYYDEMPPMATLAGYALPRLFIEQIGYGKGKSPEELDKQMARGSKVLRKAIEDAKTPNELLARAAEGMAHADVPVETVLNKVLSRGWLGEHNARMMLADFKQELARVAPTVWEHYQSLTPAEQAWLA